MNWLATLGSPSPSSNADPAGRRTFRLLMGKVLRPRSHLDKRLSMSTGTIDETEESPRQPNVVRDVAAIGLVAVTLIEPLAPLPKLLASTVAPSTTTSSATMAICPPMPEPVVDESILVPCNTDTFGLLKKIRPDLPDEAIVLALIKLPVISMDSNIAGTTT